MSKPINEMGLRELSILNAHSERRLRENGFIGEGCVTNATSEKKVDNPANKTNRPLPEIINWYAGMISAVATIMTLLLSIKLLFG